jgi:hypothetical protein
MKRILLFGVAWTALASPFVGCGAVRAGDTGQFDFHHCVDGVPKGSRLRWSIGGFWYYTPDNLEEALAWRDGVAECRRISGEMSAVERGRASDAAVRKAAGY